MATDGLPADESDYQRGQQEADAREPSRRHVVQGPFDDDEGEAPEQRREDEERLIEPDGCRRHDLHARDCSNLEPPVLGRFAA